MIVEEIIQAFEDEFKPVKDKFIILKLLKGVGKFGCEEIASLQDPLIWHPGVYVFFGKGKPYKVGRHLENSRFRVLQHLQDRTGNERANIWDIKDAHDREIILFNVIKKEDYHWVAAVEIFLENHLKDELQIRSMRQG